MIAKYKYHLIIFVLASVLYVPFLGNVHLFDWDEINFAECAREMIATGNYFNIQINFLPFWEKPPIFIWMQVLSMKMFGVNEFAARFPNAVCGVLTMLVVFNIGRKLIDEKFGLLWVLAFSGSVLPHLYFKSGIIDPWFNLFIFLGINYFIHFENTRSNKYILLASLYIGLGVLTKGPVALLVIGLCCFVYYFMLRFRNFPSISSLLLFVTGVLVVGGLWFLLLIANGKQEIIGQFIDYQVRLFNTKDAGHGGPFYYHALVLLVGCFPSSVFALASFFRSGNLTPFQKLYLKWMRILFWVVLILFSVVQTKIVHYSSLCYFPLSFLAAITLYRIFSGELVLKRALKVLLLVIGSTIGIALAGIQLVHVFKSTIIASGKVNDAFALENLKANVYWSGFEFLIGFILLIPLIVFYISKKVNSIYGLYTATIITTSLALLLLVPRIEGYSQRAAIDFFESKQSEDCVVEVYGYKSYAHLFYAQKKADADTRDADQLINDSLIAKPVYIVSKCTEDLTKFNQLKELYKKNGFVFYQKINNQ